MTSKDDTADNVKAILLSVITMFYRPLVISDGWRWHVSGFWDVSALSYWHVLGLLALYTSLHGARKVFLPSTAKDGRIALVGLGRVAIAHLVMMWAVR